MKASFFQTHGICGVVCYSVWSQPQQNSDPRLILMEKLKRVNHSTLIFMAIYPKNVYSWRENVGNVGINMCEREKIAGYASDSCQNPGEPSWIYREERKMVLAFQEVSIKWWFWSGLKGILYVLCDFFLSKQISVWLTKTTQNDWEMREPVWHHSPAAGDGTTGQVTAEEENMDESDLTWVKSMRHMSGVCG